jgi:hypothetical protein
VLPWKFNANVDPAYELWKTVGTSCITDVRDITTASNFQEPEDEERLSEMLAVRLHLNNTKPFKDVHGKYLRNVRYTTYIEKELSSRKRIHIIKEQFCL